MPVTHKPAKRDNVEEDRKALYLRIAPELYNALEREAKDLDISLNNYAQLLLRGKLQRPVKETNVPPAEEGKKK